MRRVHQGLGPAGDDHLLERGNATHLLGEQWEVAVDLLSRRCLHLDVVGVEVKGLQREEEVHFQPGINVASIGAKTKATKSVSGNSSTEDTVEVLETVGALDAA